MAHRALIVFTFALVTAAVAACGGAISETSSNVSQAQQGASTDAPATPPPPPPSEEAPPPCDGDRPPPPPHENGGKCGACIDEHFVCCSAPEPCAGYCVPDCRPAPERCPTSTACDQASGVCVRQ